MHYIYTITNLVNYKVYVGQTYTPKNRWSAHKSESKSDRAQYPVHLAIKKYGEKNFQFCLIDYAITQEEIDRLEIYWIGQFDSLNPEMGYNLAIGGNINSGWHHTIESKEKIRASQLGKINSDETRKNMSVSAKNRKRKSRQGWSSKRLTSSEKVLIIREYNDGKISITQLSHKYNRSLGGILNVLRNGPDIRPNKGSSKLSYKNAIEIRRKFASGDLSTRELANKYNVGVHAIRRIIRNETYKGTNI